MVFFDTSVIIAALLADHPAHERCFPRLAQASRRSAAMGVRSLAELYATLTGLPRRPKILPGQALELIEGVERRVRVVEITSEDYRRVLAGMAELHLFGSNVYDALLVECARKVHATEICTLNLRHFRAVAPDLADKIVEP